MRDIEATSFLYANFARILTLHLIGELKSTMSYESDRSDLRDQIVYVLDERRER